MPDKLVVGTVLWVTTQASRLGASGWQDRSSLKEKFVEWLYFGLLEGTGRDDFLLVVAIIRPRSSGADPCACPVPVASGSIRYEPGEVRVPGPGSREWGSGPRVLIR